jgi:antitoxin ParD1/3/4
MLDSSLLCEMLFDGLTDFEVIDVAQEINSKFSVAHQFDAPIFHSALIAWKWPTSYSLPDFQITGDTTLPSPLLRLRGSPSSLLNWECVPRFQVLLMSKFDIPIASAKNRSMNVSLPEQMEQFVRQKVAVGDYETASEVVREGLRLLKQRDDLWKAKVRSKIKQGMDSIRAGRSIPAQQVKAEMAAFKKKWKKNRSLK